MSKSTKIIVAVTVLLCMLLVGVTIFVNNYHVGSYTDKNGWIHNESSQTSYDTDENLRRSYALVEMDKELLTNIDAHTFIETISPILNGYSTKLYTTFMFDDGTGVYYPESNIDNIAVYGEINETGFVTQEIGTIDVNGMTITYKEAPAMLSVESKNMYQYLPDKYKTDTGAVVVEDNCLYINVGLQSRVSKEEAYLAANEVYDAFKAANLSRFENIEIVVNNEYVYTIIDDIVTNK